MEYLTVAEAADITRERPATIARRCAAGQIKAIKLGKQWRIARADLDAFMTPATRSRPSPQRDRRSVRQRREKERRQRAAP